MTCPFGTCRGLTLSCPKRPCLPLHAAAGGNGPERRFCTRWTSPFGPCRGLTPTWPERPRKPTAELLLRRPMATPRGVVRVAHPLAAAAARHSARSDLSSRAASSSVNPDARGMVRPAPGQVAHSAPSSRSGTSQTASNAALRPPETTSLGNGAQPSSRRGGSASHEPTLDRQRPRAVLELGREQIRKLAVRADDAEGFEGGARLGRPRPP